MAKVVLTNGSPARRSRRLPKVLDQVDLVLAIFSPNLR
jgi:hypothetical protein